jgi:purine catabolism regulator
VQPPAESTGAALSLHDLLTEREFGLKLLTGGADALARPVLGAHTVEVEEPSRWLAEQWVMLTTGVRLRGRAASQRALIRELDDAGVTALGFGVGVVFKKVPSALSDEAAARSFPLFEVPYETPFREITRFVDGALGRDEAHLFRRLSALQRYLVDALREPEPEQALLERLAGFLDATAVIVDGPGGVEDSDAHTVAVPIGIASDEPRRHLVVSCRRSGYVARLLKPAADIAAPLLAAISGVGDLVRAQEEAVRAALLGEALSRLDQHEIAAVSARAASFGLDFTQPARVVVIAAPNLEGARRRLDPLRVPRLVAQRDQALVVLVQAPDAVLEEQLALLARSDPDTVIGVGRAIDSIERAPDSLRDAELAVGRAALGAAGRVLRFEDFDLGTFLISEAQPDRLAPKVEQTLSVLRANPALLEAVRAYFHNDLDIRATAASLHLHPNSLRYRLGRVETLLGRSLKQPSTITSLYIALLAGGPERPS